MIFLSTLAPLARESCPGGVPIGARGRDLRQWLRATRGGAPGRSRTVPDLWISPSPISILNEPANSMQCFTLNSSAIADALNVDVLFSMP
jgi:hypothetical protein